MNGWLQEFPTLDQASLRIVKKTFDEGNRSFKWSGTVRPERSVAKSKDAIARTGGRCS